MQESMARNTEQSSSESPKIFNNQDFYALRELHLKKGVLFQDEEFPADLRVIGPHLIDELKIQNMQWRRPPEFCKNPHLIVDGASYFDILQNKIGDCWVLSTIGSVTQKQNLLIKIIPADQGFTKNYIGIFHFRFWCSGEWVDVVIDDRLPFVNGDFFSVRPSCTKEYWPCLLEKAYAKLLGGYQNLHWGDPAEAMVNFTGALTMTLKLKGGDLHPSDIWEMVHKSKHTALITCISEKADIMTRNRSYSVPNALEYRDERRGSEPANYPENIQIDNGLVDRHAYTVTDTAQVYREGLVNLIRLWNPWGRGEWIGRWSDNCSWWNDINPEDRKKLNTKREDGEFWIPWVNFVQQFSRIIICSPTLDFLNWGSDQTSWHKTAYKNIWPKECGLEDSFNKDLFCKNPQYLIWITPSDEVKKGYNVIISLMQNHRNRQKFGHEWLPIGFLVSKVGAELPDPQMKMPGSFFPKDLQSGIHIKKRRDVTKGFRLAAGRYVITPFNADRNQESSFLLQVFLRSQGCTVELGDSQSFLRNEEKTHEDIFMKYATQGGKMNARDLQKFLNDVISKGFAPHGGIRFSIEASRSMLASMDFTCNGKLECDFFKRLWRYLDYFKAIFTDADVDGSGFIGLEELSKAVKTAGIAVSSDQLTILLLRYGDYEMKLNFEDYLCCMVRLKSAFKRFQMLTSDGKGVYLSHDKWLKIMMSC
ncbi:calpain 3 isoform X2 [Xenopus laevis]|uniref:Calpain 3 isoform X2 n=1 Tax=Xenopus laevis TaxID=8355 RepID=A0A8J0VE06_XENLA|nr:calpain 3 isoform X2 [Xenopus laevis]